MPLVRKCPNHRRISPKDRIIMEMIFDGREDPPDDTLENILIIVGIILIIVAGIMICLGHGNWGLLLLFLGIILLCCSGVLA